MAGSAPHAAGDDHDDRDKPGDPDEPGALARRSAEAMYAEDGASRSLGIRVEGVAPGRAAARMRVAPSMVNGHGIAHGGYVFLLADTAFAFACNTYGVTTVARGAEIVFVTPAREGDDLLAAAEERVRYGRSGVYDVTVRRVAADGEADGGEIVAEFRGQSQSLGSASGAGHSTPAEGTRGDDHAGFSAEERPAPPDRAGAHPAQRDTL